MVCLYLKYGFIFLKVIWIAANASGRTLFFFYQRFNGRMVKATPKRGERVGRRESGVRSQEFEERRSKNHTNLSLIALLTASVAECTWSFSYIFLM